MLIKLLLLCEHGIRCDPVATHEHNPSNYYYLNKNLSSNVLPVRIEFHKKKKKKDVLLFRGPAAHVLRGLGRNK